MLSSSSASNSGTLTQSRSSNSLFRGASDSSHTTSTQSQSGGIVSNSSSPSPFASPSSFQIDTSTKKDMNGSLFGGKPTKPSSESTTALRSSLDSSAKAPFFGKSGIQFKPYKQSLYTGSPGTECFQSITASPGFRNRSFEVRDRLPV